MAKIDHKALELVEDDLEKGADLTFQHVGEVFGTDFWVLLVEGFLDSQEAARAIQGAINRLRQIDATGDDVDWEEDESDE